MQVDGGFCWVLKSTLDISHQSSGQRSAYFLRRLSGIFDLGANLSRFLKRPPLAVVDLPHPFLPSSLLSENLIHAFAGYVGPGSKRQRVAFWQLGLAAAALILLGLNVGAVLDNSNFPASHADSRLEEVRVWQTGERK